jgi:large subunit ribosomal protein L6
MSLVKKQLLRKPQHLSLQFIPSKNVLMLKGPCGTIYHEVFAKLFFFSNQKKFWLRPRKHMKKSSFCLNQVLLAQSCLGVSLGYRKQLNLMGIGYQASTEKSGSLSFLILKLGFSHLVKIVIPDYIEIKCPKPRVVLIKGINLQKVNNFASLIRDLKLPNPYKEKGFFYKGEVVKLKQGKKT